MRVKRIVLEHHCNVAILRRNIVDEAVADIELTLGDLLETRDHAQRCGLSAAGRPNEHDEFLVRDLKIEILHGDHALVGNEEVGLALCGRFALFLLGLFPVAAGEGVNLFDVLQSYVCHTI